MATLFWWTITFIFLLVGIVGTVVPLIPGAILIFTAALINYLTLHSIGLFTLLILGFLAFLSLLLDLVSGAVGGKWFGASRLGAIGGIIGAIVGIFFGFVGILIGPLLGALIGELLGGKGVVPAGRSSVGTFIGTTTGLIGKCCIGLLMVLWFLIAAFS